MEQWAELRRRVLVLVEGVSRRQILRETGMHRRTLAKILAHSEPPGYRLERPRAKPKLGPYVGRIEQILEDDWEMPRKQRHTAKRIWERLREAGYAGGYTTVKEAVNSLRRTRQEVFVPLEQRNLSGGLPFSAPLSFRCFSHGDGASVKGSRGRPLA